MLPFLSSNHHPFNRRGAFALRRFWCVKHCVNMNVTLYITNARLLTDHKEEALALLAPKRHAAAEAMVREGDCLLQCAAGLLLRHVLRVEEEQFTIGAFGKPSLAGGPHFSLSYCGDYAALAVAEENVGVDVEKLVRPDILPRKMLTGEEMAWLTSHTTAEDFCLLWTRLESALKAEGCGLAVEERTFSLLHDGTPWHWDSRRLDGHVFTCAAMKPMNITVITLTDKELFYQEGN